MSKCKIHHDHWHRGCKDCESDSDSEPGGLILPKWNYPNPFVRVPRRHKILATYTNEGIEFCVACNHPKTLFWIKAVGPGFSGMRSNLSRTITTRSEQLANLWIAAVDSGNVRIEE